MSEHRWLANLIGDAVASAIGLGVVIGTVITVARALIEQRWGSVAQFVAGLTAAVLAGVLVALALSSMQIPETLKVAIACGVSYLGDEALTGLRALGTVIARDPLEASRRVVRALRGKGGE